MIKPALSVAVISVLVAMPALALEVSKSTTIPAPPAKVWATIGTFCGIGDWHPAIASCELSKKGSKQVRTLSLKGGGTIVEEELARSDSKLRYTYAILSSPLPVAHYTSTLAVTAEGSVSKVTWIGHFSAKGAPDGKAEEVIGGIYDAGLKGIADKSQAQ